MDKKENVRKVRVKTITIDMGQLHEHGVTPYFCKLKIS